MSDTINPIPATSQSLLALLMQVHKYEKLNMMDVHGISVASNIVLIASEQVMNVVDE